MLAMSAQRRYLPPAFLVAMLVGALLSGCSSSPPQPQATANAYLAAWAKDPAMKGAVAFLVGVDLGKTVRVNITAQESQINAIDRRAGEVGMTRSAYMVQAALGRHLTKRTRAAGARSGRK